MFFLSGTAGKPETANIFNQTQNGNNKPDISNWIISNSSARPDNIPSDNGAKQLESKTPRFTVWKGEAANEALKAAWDVSGGDKDFILTMTAENGSWDLYKKHPVRNFNKTYDYSQGLNDAYHMPFIKKILAKQVTPTEIMQYHYNIYKQRKGAFYGYYKRNKVKHLIEFN